MPDLLTLAVRAAECYFPDEEPDLQWVGIKFWFTIPPDGGFTIMPLRFHFYAQHVRVA